MPRDTWLERSGQRWIGRTATASGALSILTFLCVFVAPRGWIALPALLTPLLSSAALLLPMLVHCRICDWRLETSSAARSQKATRWPWMQSLAACPVCGDDGTASAESRAAWLASGRTNEPAYWSVKRLLIGLAFVLIFVLGGLIIGANTKP